MFVLLLTYVKPLDDVDGLTIAAGDPFVTGGVATCEIVQFRASQTAPGFDA